MSLIYFLFLILFYGVCSFAIYWLLKRFVSSKPWHRWVRYGVLLLFVALLTFDTIYYKIAVVDGLCADDKTRVYHAPPASYVIAVSPSADELKKIYGEQVYYIWSCKNADVEGACLVNNKLINGEDYQENLLFGNKREGFAIKDVAFGEVYYKSTSYSQAGQWLAKKLFDKKQL